MPNKILLIIVSVVIVLIMAFGNKKVRVLPLLKNQFRVFKDARTETVSIWDIVCFTILPIVLACLITIGLKCVIKEALAGVLTTVFAFIFTVLFGFAAIIVGKINSKNIIEKNIVGETFVSIMTSNILSLISAILSISLYLVKNQIAEIIISICIYSFSFMIIMLLLMITKRTFIIYCNNKDK